MTHQHDIEEIGPGGWYMIHMFCGKAIDPPTTGVALGVISGVREWFFCIDCRSHFNQFATRRPPGLIANEPGGLFRWSIDVHNDVNIRRGKPTWSYEQAFEHYLGEGSECHNCHKGKSQTVSTPMSPLKHVLTHVNPHSFMIGR